MSHFKLIFSIFAIALGALFLALFVFIVSSSKTSYAVAREETPSHFEKNQGPSNSEEQFTPTPEQEKSIRRAIELFSKKESFKGLDPRQLIPRSFKTDRGIDHIKFDQKHPSGVPVFKGWVGLHIKDDRISFISGSFEKGLEKMEIEPTISDLEAVEVARRFLEEELERNMELPEKPAKLVILPSAFSPGKKPYLSWHVVIEEPNLHHRWNVFVDAHRGEVIFHYDAVCTVKQSSLGTGSGYYTNGNVQFTTKWDSSNLEFMMENVTRHITVYDEMVSISTQFSDENNLWGIDSDDQKPAVDVFWSAIMTHKYYLNVFGRNGLDGTAGNIHLVIDYEYDNAYWDEDRATFGVIDNEESGPLTSLDIVAHELTHGVIEFTADLLYANIQTGGLNEGFADIMATCVEFYSAQTHKSGHMPADWWLGEDVFTPLIEGDALRYMDWPPHDGNSIDHYSLYYSGMDPHYSSGIARNAFYLLAHGGTNQTSGMSVNQPIGIDAAQQIFYHTLVHYLTPGSSFHDCALATIQSANDIYGISHPEYSGAVIQAWRAVGVFPSLSFGETLQIDRDVDFPPE